MQTHSRTLCKLCTPLCKLTAPMGAVVESALLVCVFPICLAREMEYKHTHFHIGVLSMCEVSAQLFQPTLYQWLVYLILFFVRLNFVGAISYPSRPYSIPTAAMRSCRYSTLDLCYHPPLLCVHGCVVLGYRLQDFPELKLTVLQVGLLGLTNLITKTNSVVPSVPYRTFVWWREGHVRMFRDSHKKNLS